MGSSNCRPVRLSVMLSVSRRVSPAPFNVHQVPPPAESLSPSECEFTTRSTIRHRTAPRSAGSKGRIHGGQCYLKTVGALLAAPQLAQALTSRRIAVAFEFAAASLPWMSFSPRRHCLRRHAMPVLKHPRQFPPHQLTPK